MHAIGHHHGHPEHRQLEGSRAAGHQGRLAAEGCRDEPLDDLHPRCLGLSHQRGIGAICQAQHKGGRRVLCAYEPCDLEEHRQQPRQLVLPGAG